MKIFLIDEKLERQEKYGWTVERLKREGIECIRDYDAFKKIGFYTICQEENIVLFHDSFFKNQNKEGKEEEKYQQDFEQKVQNLFRYIKFGGSIGFTDIAKDKNSVTLPVSQFYTHLESFLEDKKYILEKIAYGENYKQENLLILKNKLWNKIFSYSNEKILDNDKKDEILEDFNYDEIVESILSKNNTILEIKNALNQWKI
jgi:hypothetical protein